MANENERQKVFDRALNTLANVMNADSIATKGNPKMRNDAFTILADAKKISRDELVVKGKELADTAGADVRRSSLITQMVLDAINKGLPNTKESIKTYLETDTTRKELNKRIMDYDNKSKTRPYIRIIIEATIKVASLFRYDLVSKRHNADDNRKDHT